MELVRNLEVAVFCEVHELFYLLLYLKLQILATRESDVLRSVASVETAFDVHVVVLDNAEDEIGGGDAICSLCCHEHPELLDWCVDVITACGCVRNVVVRHISNIMSLQEFDADVPRARTNDFIDPLNVFKYLDPFELIHHELPLLLNRLLIPTHSDDQVDMREELLSLLEDFSVTYVEHVEDAIRVNPHWVVGVVSFLFKD